MKFRQFEFRLFPRLRNRKKKKTKFNHPDYPRDISLDKNSNLCEGNFPCFYDNFAAETAISEQFPGYVLCRSNDSVFDTFENSSNDDTCSKIFPFKELKIDIDSSCGCSNCANFADHVTDNPMTCEVFSGSCVGSLGTPNTIPKSRTRIKTNPWLPSPRSTPSPTGTYQQIEEFGDNENSNINRPSTLPLLTPYSSDCLKTEKYMTTSFSGLAEIPEHGIINDGSRKKLYDHGGEYLYKSIRNRGKSIETENIVHSPLDNLLKDDSNYETDVSGCSSPLNEFLKCVKYEINFAYEKNADELLEHSSFPRDDSFNSIINIRTDIPDKVELDDNDKPISETKIEDDIDLTFGNSNNNMQESIDTGYGSVSPDSDFLSSDEEFGTNSESRYVSKDSESIPDEDKDTAKVPESSTESVGEFQKHSVSKQDMDQAHDVDLSKDKDVSIDFSDTSDLEWDDEPMTQTLILEFPHVIPNQNELSFDNDLVGKELDSYQPPVKRYNSVKYRKNRATSSSDKECICRRRRSRSLADIELSLDEKVVLLREEKTFVQRKIHEAILEERVREHQMKIFRLLSGDRKKKLIEQTLHSLKTRLEDQSARLQASYSTVLSLQNIYSKRKVNLINEVEQNEC